MAGLKGKQYKGAVFLDRDGTINEDTGYIGRPDEIILINGAAAAIKALNLEKIPVIVISNQSGVGRGLFTEKDVETVNLRLVELLNSHGARIDAFYYCPHHPDDNCECRKPGQGLIKKAALEHGITLENSYVVGDKTTDMGLAKGAGARKILVKTGMGRSELLKLKTPPDFVADDLSDAIAWILNDIKSEG